LIPWQLIRNMAPLTMSSGVGRRLAGVRCRIASNQSDQIGQQILVQTSAVKKPLVNIQIQVGRVGLEPTAKGS
jgi:hypothetical protein